MQYELEEVDLFIYAILSDRAVDKIFIHVESEQELGVVLNACASWGD